MTPIQELWLHSFVLHHRTWFAKASAAAPELLAQLVLPERLRGAELELAPYLADSLGNPTRIDYGTGHETTFCALLCCLAKLGVLTEADLQVGVPSPHCANFGKRLDWLLLLTLWPSMDPFSCLLWPFLQYCEVFQRLRGLSSKREASS